MAQFSHKRLIVAATALFLSHMQGSEVKPYRYTANYPTVTQMGMGTAAGLFGAGLSTGYSNPYITGTAGAALTALLAKKAWDTVSLPKIQRSYWPMALSTVGGISSGALLAKLLQNRGWNPYILAAVAAGTGALCGLGAQYGEKYLEIDKEPEQEGLQASKAKKDVLVKHADTMRLDEASKVEEVLAKYSNDIAKDKKGQLYFLSGVEPYRVNKILGAISNRNYWNLGTFQANKELNELIQPETYLQIQQTQARISLISSLKQGENDGELLHLRDLVLKLPLTDEERKLIQKSYSKNILLNILENKLDDRTKNLILMKDVDLNNFSSWFAWAKAVINSPADKEMIFKYLPNHMPDDIKSYLRANNRNKEVVAATFASSENTEDFLKKIRNSSAFTQYQEKQQEMQKDSKRRALVEKYKKEFSELENIHTLLYEGEFSAGNAIGSKRIKNLRTGVVGEVDIKNILSRISPEYEGIESISKRYNSSNADIQKEKRAILTWLIKDAYHYLKSIENSFFITDYNRDDVINLATSLQHIKNISQISGEPIQNILLALDNLIFFKEQWKSRLGHLALPQVIKQYLFDVENKLKLLE